MQLVALSFQHEDRFLVKYVSIVIDKTATIIALLNRCSSVLRSIERYVAEKDDTLVLCQPSFEKPVSCSFASKEG